MPGRAALTKNEAARKVGELMGKRQFGDAMAGAMIPRGEVSAAEVLGLVYGRDAEVIRLQLESWCKKSYKECERKHIAAYKKRHG